MRIPKELEILGHKFTVIEDNEALKDNDGVYGYCDHHCQEIAINTNLPKTLRESTFIHEILEAIIALQEIKIKHEDITALEIGLYSAFKNLLK